MIQMNRKTESALRELYIYITTFGDVVKDTLDARKYVQYHNSIRETILKDEKRLLSEYPELSDELQYIRRTGRISVFNAPFEEVYEDIKPAIMYDRKTGLKYLVHNGKRLYYRGDIRNTLISFMYRSVCCEQDARSPHRYLDIGENLHNAVLFDCGCAEANFALEVMDEVKAAYLFEGDKAWMKPLHATFLPWKDKVTIKNAFIGSAEKKMLSLCSYMNELTAKGRLDPENDDVFIKMDIEGAEIEVLKDILPLFGKFGKLRLAVCVYHNPQDEKLIRELIPEEYSCRVRDGHMLFLSEGSSLSYPYFRHGIMRIERVR